ncbi:hypothetical protein CVT26_008660 [Gymnopilus dilepis]|uniref:Uncharacterized protein n=1 Tax=Gymnopilus dilepis TaxID=231916 RepID=A0A409XXY7_9AGAR|nr:hypothetical protein CVT26_008660 [Gymnopilus dilepis]
MFRMTSFGTYEISVLSILVHWIATNFNGRLRAKVLREKLAPEDLGCFAKGRADAQAEHLEGWKWSQHDATNLVSKIPRRQHRECHTGKKSTTSVSESPWSEERTTYVDISFTTERKRQGAPVPS